MKNVTYAGDAPHYVCIEFTVHSVSSYRVEFARRHPNSLKICKNSNYKQVPYSVNRTLYSVRIRLHDSAKSDESSSGLITRMKREIYVF